MKELTIGVIGGGVVGGATGRSLLEHVREVRWYDIDPRRTTHTLEQVLECDIVFVCLPTPQKAESLACDTSAIDRFFFAHDLYDVATNFVLRSTVPIGYTRSLAKEFKLPNLVHSPEFLTARCADADAAMPSRLVIGQPNLTSGEGGIFRGMVRLQQLYQERWPGVPVLTMRSDDSEALKLFTNSFFAIKVASFNEFHDYATKTGLDWEAIVGAMRLDRHINPAHTQVPGPDGQRGYGGHCLPKDVASLLYQMDTCNLTTYPPLMCQAAVNRNSYDRNRKAGP